MRLCEVDPGSTVVVIENGEQRYLYLGALLSVKSRKGNTVDPHTALVHLVDPESLLVVEDTWRSASTELEVIAVVEPAGMRRMMRKRWWHGGRATTADTSDEDTEDPMIGRVRTKEGTFR